MFKRIFVFIIVLCCFNFVNAQNVFSPSDPIVTFNTAAALGTAAHPNIPANGVMSKWGRTPYTWPAPNPGFTPWNTSDYKCYIWNGLAFRLRFPNNYDPSGNTKYPMLIFLHGGGEFASNVYDNELHLVWAADTFQVRINRGEWNGFVLFQQALTPAISWNDYHFSRMNSIMDTLQKYNNLDPDRTTVMGLSEGGFGCLNYASLYPQRIAASLPASPVEPDNTNGPVSNFIHVPVWLANGGLDNNPNPNNVSDFYYSFRHPGGNIYQTFLANDGHTTWVHMWNMRDNSGTYISTSYWNSAHKAQPLVYFQNQTFCAAGPIAARMGISAGYSAYEWQKDGSTIAGATGNEYTATQVGQYRVRFQHVATGIWSDWTPNPVVVSTKTCATDTLFTEHFSSDNSYTAADVYNNNNFPCQSGIKTSGTDLFTQDAAGVQGGMFDINFTKSGTGCTYTAGAEVWGPANLITVVPNKDYEFTFYVGNQTSTSRAQLIPKINGLALTAVAAQTTGVGNASWKKFTYTWNSGTATIADLSIINNNSATSGNDFAIDEISFKLAATLRTLPVTWLGVSAKLVNKEVQVLWKVANEVNVNNYVVQRSTDGISFTEIALVNASTATTIEKQYTAYDRAPQLGVNYYRIRQTDNDGRYTYSQTVLVNVTEAGGLVVWPNPATTTLTVQNGQPMQRLQCYNSNGQLLYDVKPAASQYAIPVQQWPAGVYYIQITGNNLVQQTRFVKK